MDADDRDLLRGLLTEERLLSLGLLVEREPVVGLLPFTATDDFAAVYVQASSLARHSRGLTSGARFGAVIHRPDSPERDPLQTPRLILDGVVEPLDDTSPALEPATRAFLKRFPSSAMTLALDDFGLYRLEIRRGRLVGGFARARNLSPSDLRALAEE